MEADLSLPCAFHIGPVPDSFQKLTRSLGSFDLCISLKDRHVLCFVSKASGQTRGPDPGFPATDASLLQGTETRAGNTLGFNLSTQTVLGGQHQARKFRVGVRKQPRALFACRPTKDGEKQALAVLPSWGPRPTSRLCCSRGVHCRSQADTACPAGPAEPRAHLPRKGLRGPVLDPSPAHLQRCSEPIRCPQVATSMSVEGMLSVPGPTLGYIWISVLASPTYRNTSR